jgi:hypothetical protein
MSVTKVTDAMRNVTTVDGTKISGAVPSGALTNVDLSKLEYNQAILAFKVASANQLAKFSMVDQVIDEYQDATGIDAGNSTNELAGGATTAKYYEGGTSSTPTTSSVGSVASTGTVDGDYTYYKWLSGSTGTFTTDTAQDYEYLVIAGGGGGSAGNGGGGGAGGYLTATGFPVAAAVGAGTSVSGITVGSGGAGGLHSGYVRGVSGTDSVFSTITSTGGGGAGTQGSNAYTGGSGGGGGYNSLGSSGTVGPPRQGYDGGDGAMGPNYPGGGGGGSSVAGGDATGSQAGDGGLGTASSITGSSVTRGGGGGGSTQAAASTAGNYGGTAGALGGGGIGSTTGTVGGNGTDNTGGGGGGAQNQTGGVGGSGIVVIRRLTTITSSGGNLTLQSVATTAESAPTTADLVVLIEDGAGTATVNTDIKGFVSRDGTAFSTAVTFVDEGDWGTNKRILVARNIDISGITTGTAMKYKLTTHNQSASSKETRIHATSLAWA